MVSEAISFREVQTRLDIVKGKVGNVSAQRIYLHAYPTYLHEYIFYTNFPNFNPLRIDRLRIVTMPSSARMLNHI